MKPPREARLRQAIGAAVSFLLDSRSEDGLWRDFRTLAGASSEWVSGFVASSLGAARAAPETLRAALLALLQRQRPSGGWGYNERVPPDCDSTAWVLVAMSGRPVWKPSMILRGLAYLRRHGGESGFATYLPEDGIEGFIGAEAADTEGWRQPHLCVTAVAVRALLLHGLGGDGAARAGLAALSQDQARDGLWYSYWWPGAAYATAQSLRTLACAGALPMERWRAAADAVIRLQQDDGGFGDEGGPAHSFATAMGLSALLTRPDPACDEAVDAAAAWLLREQRAGSWPSHPILRIPRPMERAPDAGRYVEDALGTAVILRDERRLFTTAAAMGALADYRDWLKTRPDG